MCFNDWVFRGPRSTKSKSQGTPRAQDSSIPEAATCQPWLAPSIVVRTSNPLWQSPIPVRGDWRLGGEGEGLEGFSQKA